MSRWRPAAGWPDRIGTLAAVTAVMYLVGAAGLLTSAAFYTAGKNPRWLLAALGVVAVVFVAWTLRRGRAFSRGEAEAMLVVEVGCISLLTHGSGIDVAAYSNGTALPLIGIYTSWFLTRRGSVIFYLGLALWLVTVALRGDHLITTMAVVVVAETVVAAEAVRVLVGRLRRAVLTDALTGTLNRRGLEAAAHDLVRRARRRQTPLALVVFDLDDLRVVNNTRGHQAGDALLARASRQWLSRLDSGAAIGRIGGDEFIAILPETDRAAAEALVAALARDSPARWTAGVAELGPDDTFEDLVEQADQEMYRHKRHPLATAAEGPQEGRDES